MRGEYLADEIMSKQKSTFSDARKLRVTPAVRGNGIVAGSKAPEPEVVALEIDDSDYGGDPYNHTGSFCVLKFSQDD